MFRSEIENELREVLQVSTGRNPGPLSIMNWYHMGFSDTEGKIKAHGAGKYVRPQLCIAIAAGLGAKPSTALPAAAAIELIHRTSLIFDDIQDNGMSRNGQSTLWAMWGMPQAINAGLVLSCYSRLATHRLNLPDDVILKINRTLEDTVIKVTQGQYWDIAFQTMNTVSVEKYMNMIMEKTAALFSTSCLVGAYCSNQGDVQCDQYTAAKSLGSNLGMAFQIWDDFLGVWGDPELMGKPANDLDEMKKSLPVVLALRKNPCIIKTWIEGIIGPHEISEWMTDNGIREEMADLARMYLIRTKHDLKVLNLQPEYEDFVNTVIMKVTDRIL